MTMTPRSFFRAAERRGDARDRAVMGSALAGLRLSELAGLDVDDVALSARKGTVTIRHGKGDASRSVPLSTEARGLLELWLRERPSFGSPALSSAPPASVSTRALARAVGRIGEAAGVELSASRPPPHLRHPAGPLGHRCGGGRRARRASIPGDHPALRLRDRRGPCGRRREAGSRTMSEAGAVLP